MDIVELRLRKKKLELEITKQVAVLVAAFGQDTGIYPTTIDICLFPVISIGGGSTVEVGSTIVTFRI